MANNNLIGRNLWLRDSQVCAEAPAKVEVVQGLAGRARILWELATGQVPGDGPPASGYNPQGLVGVDCSGPPWGSAHRHTIAHLGGIKPDSATFSSRPSTYFALRGIASDYRQGIDWRIWNRPYERLPSPGIAPLSRAYLLLSGYSSSATNPVLTVYGFTNNEALSEATSTTVTTTGGTTDTAYQVNHALYLRLRPGPNVVHLRFESDTASATAWFTITKLQLCHWVKRSH